MYSYGNWYILKNRRVFLKPVKRGLDTNGPATVVSQAEAPAVVTRGTGTPVQPAVWWMVTQTDMVRYGRGM